MVLLYVQLLTKNLFAVKHLSYHLVGQDPVDPVLVQGDHPVQPTYLVVSHFTILNIFMRGRERMQGGDGRLYWITYTIKVELWQLIRRTIAWIKISRLLTPGIL